MLFNSFKYINYCIKQGIEHINEKLKERKRIRSKYLKCNTKVISQNKYKKIRKNKKIKNIGSNFKITVYKNGNNNKIRELLWLLKKLK